MLLLIGNYDTGDAVVDVDYGDHGEYDEWGWFCPPSSSWPSQSVHCFATLVVWCHENLLDYHFLGGRVFWGWLLAFGAGLFITSFGCDHCVHDTSSCNDYIVRSRSSCNRNSDFLGTKVPGVLTITTAIIVHFEIITAIIVHCETIIALVVQFEIITAKIMMTNEVFWNPPDVFLGVGHWHSSSAHPARITWVIIVMITITDDVIISIIIIIIIIISRP